MTERNKNSRKTQIRFEIAAYIVWNLIVSPWKRLIKALVPAAQEMLPVRSFIAAVTLEGPRLMLVSRYRAARMERGKKVGISAISGASIASIIIATVLIGSQLIAVTVDGRIIGYVENEEQYASLLQSAKTKISEQIGTDTSEIIIQDTRVSLETIIASQPPPVAAPEQSPPANTDIQTFAALSDDSETAADAVEDSADGSDSENSGEAPAYSDEPLLNSLIESLMAGSDIKATFYTIYINEEEFATLATMKDASAVLKAVAEAYSPVHGDYSGRFADDVKINSVVADLDAVKPQATEDVIASLLAGVTEERSYTAGSGDSLSSICLGLGITEQQLCSIYPGIEYKPITEGDVYSATVNTPYINYVTEGNEITNELVPFDTIEEITSDIIITQREVKEEGVPGERVVTRFVTRSNGVIVEQFELESQIVKEPKSEVVLVGTKAYFNSGDFLGTGPLSRPLDNWYLSRSVGGAHYGADMLAPRGTPIYAAAYGTVTHAGVYGLYGNLVILNHGNGLQTYYAHCDKIIVEVGDVVERRQVIATVGTTGRSTAYHLHFEVRLDGVVQEPLLWIS